VKAITAALQTAIIALATLSFTGGAKAGGLIECNNCAPPKSVALQSGAGLTVIIDFDKAQLTAFNVEYDRELRKWRAISTPVPSQIQMAFLRIVESVSNTTGHSDQAFPKAGGGAVVPLHPDNPGNSNGMRFPDSYKSSDAFEIVNSATMRTRLGQYLALEIAGTNTSSTAWNSFALSI